MKKLGAGLLALLLLTGCSRNPTEMNRAVNLRSRLLTEETCSFTARVTADYGDSLQQFTLYCQGDGRGDLRFRVEEPQTIAGISGSISDSGGQLTFEDTALQFDLLTDQQLSPVSAPWIFLKTLRGGYLTSADRDGEQIHISARDSYQQEALFVDLWLDSSDSPVRSEILWKGRKILTLELSGFQIGSQQLSTFSAAPYNFTACVG